MTCIRRRRASWGHGTRTTAQTRFAANATEQRGKTRRLDEFVRSELTPRQPDVDLLDALPGRDLDITSLPVSESSSGRCTENPALTAPIADAATRAGSLWATHRGLRSRFTRTTTALPPIEHPTLGPTALRQGDGVVAAVVKELRTPSEERTWHGVWPASSPTTSGSRLSPATGAGLGPEDEHPLSPQPFGVGWTLNAGRAVQLVRHRFPAG